VWLGGNEKLFRQPPVWCQVLSAAGVATMRHALLHTIETQARRRTETIDIFLLTADGHNPKVAKNEEKKKRKTKTNNSVTRGRVLLHELLGNKEMMVTWSLN